MSRASVDQISERLYKLDKKALAGSTSWLSDCTGCKDSSVDRRVLVSYRTPIAVFIPAYKVLFYTSWYLSSTTATHKYGAIKACPGDVTSIVVPGSIFNNSSKYYMYQYDRDVTMIDFMKHFGGTDGLLRSLESIKLKDIGWRDGRDDIYETLGPVQRCIQCIIDFAKNNKELLGALNVQELNRLLKKITEFEEFIKNKGNQIHVRDLVKHNQFDELNNLFTWEIAEMK